MSSFDGLNLFDSGPHRFTIPGRALRHAVHEAPGEDGARLCLLGAAAKRIVQRGRLVAENVTELQERIDAIEAVMDGRAAELIDSRGVSHESMVMLRFQPGPVEIGRAASMAYEIEYMEHR